MHNATYLFPSSQDETAARATTMEQLLHRSSAELLQPTPAAAAVLPHHHLHLATAPKTQQQGQQQDAYAARPSLTDPQWGAPAASDSMLSPPEKRDVWYSLPCRQGAFYPCLPLSFHARALSLHICSYIYA